VTSHQQSPITLADVEAALETLRLSAPSTLAPSTLVAVGLADEYTTMPSPIGPVFAAWNGRGVSTVASAGDPADFEDWFRREFERAIRPASKVPPRLARALARRIAGDRHARLAVDLRGRTEFEQAVLAKALEIPRGEVRPYSWIASEIGRPKAVRAVGSALAHNPVPLVMPCHRVVRADGMIGQYSLGGPGNKRAVLSSEGLDPDAMENLARAGIRYIGSDTTRIYCLPSCRNARRVTDRHRVLLPSIAAGRARGYRGCKVCRPDAAAVAAA
jgi:O-6-methylguanine DNA methyltransferase